METQTPPIDRQVLEAMNEKTIQNQFFTPDKVYIDLSLLKDFPIGVIYADKFTENDAEFKFNQIQKMLIPRMSDYQKRTYDSVDMYLADLGYSDSKIEQLLSNNINHDVVFMMAPTSKFLDMLIRHTVRNQNNSRPAAKYTKKMIDKNQYVMEPIPVTYYFNTYPLNLSEKLLIKLGEEFGESLGVNIQFLNKDPMLFDKSDWMNWMEGIDCFYLNSLGRFTRSEFILHQQGELIFMGCYFFARKRFETCVIQDMRGCDFEQQVQMVTAQLDMMCDFSWIQNNDVRLTEEKENIPVDTPSTDETSGN